MSIRPSFNVASQLSTAISSLKEIHSSSISLNEDMRELLEQIEIVEKLPEATNLARIEGWRSRLLTKMRMKISQNEEDYRYLVDVRWSKTMEAVMTDGPAMTGISYTYEDDLRLILDFFREAHQIASDNVLFNSNIRQFIPVIPYHVDAAISRILNDVKILQFFDKSSTVLN